MKILKYKKLKSQKYQVFLDNLEILELYEETILKYDLLITKKVDEKILEELLEYNKKYEAYYTCLKYLNVRVRSRKEIKDYLKKKDYNDDVIDYIYRRAILEKEYGARPIMRIIQEHISDKVVDLVLSSNKKKNKYKITVNNEDEIEVQKSTL